MQRYFIILILFGFNIDIRAQGYSCSTDDHFFNLIDIVKQSTRLPLNEQQAVNNLYEGFTKESEHGQNSKKINFKSQKNKLFIIHPHDQYDPKGLIKGQVDQLISSEKFENFVILEGIYGKSFSDLKKDSQICKSQFPDLALKDCLRKKFDEFDPSTDIALSSLAKSDYTIGTGGSIKVDSQSLRKNEKVILTGGYFTNCQESAARAIVKSFEDCSQCESLDLNIPSNYTIDDSGPKNEYGVGTAERLDDFLKRMTWSRKDMAAWYVDQLKLSLTQEFNFSVQIQGQKVYSSEKNSKKTININIGTDAGLY